MNMLMDAQERVQRKELAPQMAPSIDGDEALLLTFFG